MELLSQQNSLLKQIRKAVSRGGLTDDGLALAEGIHLLEEAQAAGCVVEDVVVAESAVSKFDLPEARIVSDNSFRDLSTTETPQGVLALVRPRTWTLDQLIHQPKPAPSRDREGVVSNAALLVILDGVQDPGNAGAIVRAAEAFGASGLVFLKGTVNPYNSKCLRGSAGSVFRMPLVFAISEESCSSALANIKMYAAMPRAKHSLSDVDLVSPCAIVIGSEGRGVSEGLAAHATGIRIPTSHVESLNAAVAAGVILYEAHRQRGNK